MGRVLQAEKVLEIGNTTIWIRIYLTLLNVHLEMIKGVICDMHYSPPLQNKERAEHPYKQWKHSREPHPRNQNCNLFQNNLKDTREIMIGHRKKKRKWHEGIIQIRVRKTQEYQVIELRIINRKSYLRNKDNWKEHKSKYAQQLISSKKK